MKKRIAFSILALALLAAAVGCDLYTGISLTWSINSLSYNPATGMTRVGYTVQNVGRYDLKGVNLEIGVDIYNNKTYAAASWTSDFSINQNQTISSYLDVFTGVDPTPGWATVLSVDMDKPAG